MSPLGTVSCVLMRLQTCQEAHSPCWELPAALRRVPGQLSNTAGPQRGSLRPTSRNVEKPQELSSCLDQAVLKLFPLCVALLKVTELLPSVK